MKRAVPPAQAAGAALADFQQWLDGVREAWKVPGVSVSIVRDGTVVLATGSGLRDVDVVIMLRLQNERMDGALLPSAQEFFKYYGLTPEKLAVASADAIVMHPGPMNRGIEIDSSVADGRQSVILPQVTFGIAVRMAVMSLLGSG